MVELWFALLCLTLTMFVVLDGWNFGAGVLHFTVAKTTGERRQVIAALGPMWSWHEVWLVAAGGTFLLAFPGILAASFAGFYLALWLVLWSLIVRGISIEVGGHISDGLWQSAWDTMFSVSSVLLAVLFGVALGNVIRGVPLDASGKFAMALFTHFRASGRVGILDWYTLSVGIFTAGALTAHGATYLASKTTGDVHARSLRSARRGWIGVAILFPVITYLTSLVRPELFHGLATRPLAWLFALVAAAGAWAILSGLRSGHERRALLGSSAAIAGLLGGAAASLFPVMLHSTLGAEHSITAFGGASARTNLAIALFWWPVAFVLALSYFVIILRHFGDRVETGYGAHG